MAIKPVKVSQLNGYIKRILQTDPLLGNVSVIGEISNLKFHGSGHVYFSMKDEGSRLNCFLPADRAQNLRYELSEGMEITASGYIYLYERGGSYSLNIRDIEVAGLGNLSIAFEKLKAKLEAEGLFDKEHKKEIPFFPEKIAVVTSETGAAVRDILKIIKSRNNYVDVLIYPVLVQGPSAAGEIAHAIADINEKWPDMDTIITGRGGGAMEELWAFNEEIVARSIYASKIPVISAVGHETDFTIADFVADLRAPTPSAAAELAVDDFRSVLESFHMYGDRLQRAMNSKTELFAAKLKAYENRFQYLSPESMLREKRQYASELEECLRSSMEQKLTEKRHELAIWIQRFEGLSPLRKLNGGYAFVSDLGGHAVTEISQIKKGDRISIAVTDGVIEAVADRIRKEER